MANKIETLTFTQFYKANKQRRADLAKRFGYKPNQLMEYLKMNGSITRRGFSSYKEFCNLPVNVQRTIAKDEGYQNLAAYKSVLRSKFKVHSTVSTETVSTTVTSEPKNIIHVFILDESSSMGGSKADAMFSGVRETVQALKKEQKENKNANHSIGIVGFSYSLYIDRLEILKPDHVNVKSRIKGGMTALNDAVYKTLNSLQSYLKEPNTKAVVQIFTDGGENNSSTSSHTVANKIKEFEDTGVTVTFMGTEHDVLNVTNLYNLKEGNTLVHENTAESIGQTFRTATHASIAYSKAVVNDEDVSSNFYSKVLIK